MPLKHCSSYLAYELKILTLSPENINLRNEWDGRELTLHMVELLHIFANDIWKEERKRDDYLDI